MAEVDTGGVGAPTEADYFIQDPSVFGVDLPELAGLASLRDVEEGPSVSGLSWLPRARPPQVLINTLNGDERE